jgi:ABC-type branched-subunit amino acid transport system ATPase component
VSDRITVLNFSEDLRGSPQDVLRHPDVIAAYRETAMPLLEL